jgi:hypothetical protein
VEVQQSQPASEQPSGGLLSDDEIASDPSTAPEDQRTCLGETHAAEVIGLDIFVMLDISGSMLDVLPVASLRARQDTTKWDAVKRSMEAFVQAPESADIGVGLQYFPQLQPNVPDTCTSNAECGVGGPCTASVCVAGFIADDPTDNQPAVAFIGPTKPDCVGDECICASDADCGGNNAQCVGMLGVCVIPGQGVPQLPVPPLCNAQNDCLGIPGTNCEPIGLCNNSDPTNPTICVPSLGCPQGTGPCVPYPYTCVAQTVCEATSYATPAVPIATGMDHAAQIIQSLEGVQLRGLTPTGPALRGALDQARAWAAAHPDRQVVTVLATDGLPTECSPQQIPDIAQLAASESSAADPVRTFVIGVFSAADLGDDGQANLDALARAGGTDRAFVINTGGNVADDFLQALNKIRDSAVSCEFQLGAEAALDFDQVNLRLSEPSGAVSDLANVGDLSACGNDQGWYYKRAADGTPTQIEVCPSTCARFTTSGVSAELQVGCATRIR